MWRPRVNFATLHYGWILFCALLALPVLYGGGNMSAIDALHFGASAATESGLNTVDLAELPTYQQLYLYFIPIITNLGFINISVVVVRLWWFRKHLRKLAPALYRAKQSRGTRTTEEGQEARVPDIAADTDKTRHEPASAPPATAGSDRGADHDDQRSVEAVAETKEPTQHIRFDPAADHHPKDSEGAALYIPGPRDRDQGKPFVELHRKPSVNYETDDGDEGPSMSHEQGASQLRRRRLSGRYNETVALDRVATVASSVFVIGPDSRRRTSVSGSQHQQKQPLGPQLNGMPLLSNQATTGRNSQFHNLTAEDREALGGIEYTSLRLLLKIIVAYYVGLHLLGILCLAPWIVNAGAKYKDVLADAGQGQIWWAIYSTQTMVNNLGLTLTPDSMISFRDAGWPMFVMSFLAFAGNTCYPVFLRLVIWTMSKLTPSRSGRTRDALRFLLDHPRRCYTLLFPGRHTWALFVILFLLNFVDALLIVVLDLHNPEVASLPLGPRVLAAIFQSASSRHTGTASFALADVNPAVQFSLLVMMYISVFPIAMSIRASNTYEERSLGVYHPDQQDPDGQRGSAAYLISHMQNQLSFDLWYIFLGIFCIAISESDRIMDGKEPAINLFSIFFECTSAYGNVGLSLGYPGVNYSLCGEFNTFSKFVICAIMIRGRHRGLPYELDSAIMLPDQHLVDDDSTNDARGER